MLYPSNTIKWHKGAIVIHWCDSKEPKSLMRVIGYTRDGLIKTQYVSRFHHKRTIFKNDIKNLLDPRDFGLLSQDLSQEYLDSYQRDWVRTRIWNTSHPQGNVLVLVQTSDRGIVLDRTNGPVFMQGMNARVWLKTEGLYDLDGVADVSDDPQQIADAAEMAI